MSHLWCAENIFFFLNCFCTIPRETSGLVVCPRTSCDNLFLVISKYKLYKTNARCAIRSKQYLCSYCLVVLGDQKSIQCTHTFSSRLTSQRCQCFFCKVQMAVSQVQGLSLSSAMSHFFFSPECFLPPHTYSLCMCIKSWSSCARLHRVPPTRVSMRVYNNIDDRILKAWKPHVSIIMYTLHHTPVPNMCCHTLFVCTSCSKKRKKSDLGCSRVLGEQQKSSIVEIWMCVWLFLRMKGFQFLNSSTCSSFFFFF